MEDLPFFQAHDEQFSANGIYFPDEAVANYSNEAEPSLFDTKEDLQLLFDWQDHVGSIQDSFCDDLDLKFNIDLKTELPDLDSPILSNALTSQVPIKLDPVKKISHGGEKILFPGDVEPLQVSSSIQTDNVLKHITQARSVLINGEKELLGKNIIGLHCLNEIKTSPDQNCQITSTVINGKRYKIIIRPKSSAKVNQQMAKCLSEPSCMGAVKVEPTDELISELQNGDYDVLGHEDVQDPWTLPLGEDSEEKADAEDQQGTTPADPPRVPPLRIKIPKKLKKYKTKKDALKANTLGELLITFEGLQSFGAPNGERKSLLRSRSGSTASNSNPHSLLTRTHENTRNSVISGDSVQLDHDYCSYKRRHSVSASNCGESVLVEKNPRKDSGLESGGVSDASEESPTSDTQLTPDSPEISDNAQSAPILAQQLTSKLLEERRRTKNHHHVTKMAAALFRAANAVTSGHKMTDRVISNSETPGTSLNCEAKTTSEIGEASEIAPPILSPQEPITERPKKKLKLEEYRNRRHDKGKDDNPSNDFAIIKEVDSNEEPVESFSTSNSTDQEPVAEEKPIESSTMELTEPVETTDDRNNDDELTIRPPERESEDRDEHEAPRRQSRDQRDREKQKSHESQTTDGKRSAAKNRRITRRCSSSSSSGERSHRRKSLSRGRRGRSVSRDRRRNFWSPGRRSYSRDSSSSSGGSTKRRSSLNSLSRYRRRTRSRSRSPYRSMSRDNSKLRTKNYSERRRIFHGYTRQSSVGRSRSPVYTQREKQRQIEERRVVYVGRIPEGTTNLQLRQRFSMFGHVLDISVHFREHGDNYGFVTFAYKDDAYQAVEHGNDNPSLPRYDLCFGGRRSFCKQRYSDLDGMPTSYSGFKDTPVVRSRDESFDLLLKQAKEKLHQRKDAT